MIDYSSQANTLYPEGFLKEPSSFKAEFFSMPLIVKGSNFEARSHSFLDDEGESAFCTFLQFTEVPTLIQDVLLEEYFYYLGYE